MNRTQYIILILASLSIFSFNEVKKGAFANPGKHADIQEIIADFEQELKGDVQKDTIGSISSAIFIGEKIIWSKAFGKADNQKGIDADTATIYRIGSISKSFTAYLMMLLVQNGTIFLDEPVAKFLPEIKQINHNGLSDTLTITFRQLASHTSGLAREPDLPDAASGPIEGWENKVLMSIPTPKLITAPGQKFSYSNIGYGILGLALSRAAHKPFIELVEENLFKPLQMNSSFYMVKPSVASHIASGYGWNPGTKAVDASYAASEFLGRGYKVPNGGIFTTPNDLAHFIMALYGNSGTLQKRYKDQMETVQTPESRERGYGFGLSIEKDAAGNHIISHNGAVAGFLSFMAFNPETKIGIILVRNDDYRPFRFDNAITNVLVKLIKEKKVDNATTRVFHGPAHEQEKNN